ncbi:MAG: DUF2892 domain-containing protein [Candidatus Pacebacteria bacterium]|nr:DUF2892 domain-containing protein [Candidatus Paceibacterota bacterium]
MNALTMITKLKDFFIASPFGWGMIVVLYALAFIFGFILKFIIKYVQTRRAMAGVITKSKNIGTYDRLVRLAIGLAMLLVAMTTTWNPILIFASGIVVFQAVFSWCFVYQAMGKNTCPVE